MGSTTRKLHLKGGHHWLLKPRGCVATSAVLLACGGAPDADNQAIAGGSFTTPMVTSNPSASNLALPGASSTPSGVPTAAPAAGGTEDTGSPLPTDAQSGDGSPTSPTPAGRIDDGQPGRSLVRRLSNAEYRATVESLLGHGTDYTVNFPTDTIVNGFTNNTDVQDVGPALVEQYLAAAEALSDDAVRDVDPLLGCPLAQGEACIATFVEGFGKRAFRRPTTSVERTELLQLFRSEPNAVDGVRLVLQAILTSPSFLYRAEVGVPVAGESFAALNSWEIATRLSYFLTGTMPDADLFAAAEADLLVSAESVEAEARRLLATPAARNNVADFFSGWLNLSAVDRLQRDTTQFADWDSQLPPLLWDETRAFATRVIFDGDGDLTTLLTAPFTYGDPALAQYYGGTAGPVTDGVSRIELPTTQRAGLLTQASFLATHSKEIQTDPVSRGKFVRERMLCQGIPAPPADLMITAPAITPGSTTRERFAQHEEEPSCAGCHLLIDPVGLAFEHYDAIGQWRDQEQGKDIDASGDLTGTDVSGPFVGVVEMADRLAQSELARECFVRYWFRFAFGRGESDSEAARIATITGQFEAAQQDVQELLVALTLSPDFRYLAKEATQ